MAGSTCFSNNMASTKSVSGVLCFLGLPFPIACCSFTHMDPPSSPKGYRKRWREAAAGSAALLAGRALSEKDSEQALDDEVHDAESIADSVDIGLSWLVGWIGGQIKFSCMLGLRVGGSSRPFEAITCQNLQVCKKLNI